MDFVLGDLIGLNKFYQTNLDEFLIKSINFKGEKLIRKLGLNDLGFDITKHDFHRIITHYTFENCKQHQFRMVNYVALYGFLRNVALILNLLAWYFTYSCIKSLKLSSEIDYLKLTILIASMLISYIGFMAFMKFYKRYTLEGLMLTVVDENLK